MEIIALLITFVGLSWQVDYVSELGVYGILKTDPLPLLSLSVSDLPVDKKQTFKSYELPALKSPPSVGVQNETGLIYAILAFDPDYSSENKIKDSIYVTWLMTNVENGFQQIGRECIPYMNPNPPLNTGVHRIIYAVFKQQEKVNCKPIFPAFTGSNKERAGRSIDELKSMYNLTGPLMANAYEIDTNAEELPHRLYDEF
ncbi:Phosphatidylethanolamine-binding protein 1 [Thelohanellus kitauei]|uniref:Phosphatidylethanolamine-binding protein 1 n=1 Tax=Thelohanellus kitauei TaxID=669202 RepID=A0A0C2M9G0_THEKT|nr:Phosphatidylethanolamine-binding protein 1 [Thelohanellus kitauei]